MEFLDRQVVRLSGMILQTGTLTGPWQTKDRKHNEIVELYTEYAEKYKRIDDVVITSAFGAIMDEAEKVVIFARRGKEATVLLRTQRQFFDHDLRTMLHKLYGYRPPNTSVYCTKMHLPENIVPKRTDVMHAWCAIKKVADVRE